MSRHDSAPVKLAPGKPIPVHSPKVRLFMGPALENARRNRASTIGDNLDYSKENAQAPAQCRPRYSDSRGGDIVAKHTQTQVDKILNPSKEAYTEPPAPLRCPMQESRENMIKGRGTLVLVGSDPVRRPAPEVIHSRCPGNQAQTNQEKGRGLGMSTIIMHTGDYTSPRRVSKQCPDDANKTGAMGSCLDQSTKFSNSQPAPRCGDSRAREQLEKGRGCMGKVMDGTLPGDNQPPPRVKNEAKKNADMEGRGFYNTMHAGPSSESAAGPRVRPEANSNFEQGKGSLTSQQYNYNQMPSTPRAGPRVRPGPATEIAASAQGNITRNLFQKYGKLPGDSKPHANIPPRARGIAKLSRGGAMRDCINPAKSKKKRRAKSAHY